MPLKITALALALCLCLAGPLGAAPPEAVELKLIAVSAADKAKLEKAAGGWSPYLSLSLKDLGPKVEIDQRTEFYALLVDRSGKLKRRQVTFHWFHGYPPKVFAKPTQRYLRQVPGKPHSMASSSCWSAPSKGGRFWSMLFPSSVMKRAKWNKSRCYGPRTIRVTGSGGEVIAERSFEIHKKGVQIY
jgi:hypothetical protein